MGDFFKNDDFGQFVPKDYYAGKDRSDMEKCYDYFDCKQTECIVFQNKVDHTCWKTEGTLCFFPPLTPIIDDNDKKDKCNFCLYKIGILEKQYESHT